MSAPSRLRRTETGPGGGRGAALARRPSRHGHAQGGHGRRTRAQFIQALEQDPREEAEAKRLREEAERFLRLREPGVKEPGLERTYDDLVSVSWR